MFANKAVDMNVWIDVLQGKHDTDSYLYNSSIIKGFFRLWTTVYFCTPRDVNTSVLYTFLFLLSQISTVFFLFLQSLFFLYLSPLKACSYTLLLAKILIFLLQTYFNLSFSFRHFLCYVLFAFSFLLISCRQGIDAGHL